MPHFKADLSAEFSYSTKENTLKTLIVVSDCKGRTFMKEEGKMEEEEKKKELGVAKP